MTRCPKCGGLVRQDYGAPYRELACWNCGFRVYPAAPAAASPTPADLARMVEETIAEGQERARGRQRRLGSGLYTRKPHATLDKVLALRLAGVGVLRIAYEAGVSERTVERWTKKLRKKLP